MTEHCMLDYVVFWCIQSHMYGWLDWNNKQTNKQTN